MPTNHTHEELVKSKFIEKFRNPLRNYYTYGFMNYSSLHETRKTLDEDWNRLSNVLRRDQYFQWSNDSRKASFISADSQSQICNPFHRVYRFSMHTEADLRIFFNTILALSDKFELAENKFSVGNNSLPAMKVISEKRYEEICSEEREDSNGNVQSVTSMLDSFESNYLNRELTYKQIAAFCESSFSVPFLEEDQNVRKYLKSKMKLQLLKDISVDKRNIKWKLSDLTLQRFAEQCEDKADLFFDAIDFFSRYYFLGEYGTYLLSRNIKRTDSVFRFKHEYFAQALNDYIIIDLLKAMEKKLWCKLTQSNPINGEEHSLICFPLQIRSSQTKGREYLAFYAPHDHSYSYIRLDMITEIELIRNIKMNGKDISLEDPHIQQEISNAFEGINHSWGMSVVNKRENNARSPVPLTEVKVVIQFDPEKEYYILNRLKHEKRNGEISVCDDKIIFTIKVTDTIEMHPWLRSLYKRIIDYSGIDTDTINLVNDAASYNDIDSIFADLKSDTFYNTEWYIPKDTTYTTVKEKDSDALFSPYFSIYFMIFGSVLSSVYKKGHQSDDSLSAEDIKKCIVSAYKEYSNEIGSKTKDILESSKSEYNIMSELEKCRFIKRGFFDKNKKWTENISAGKTDYIYHMKYRSDSDADLYYSIIPLTAWELRWLYTILKDEKIKLFLPAETVSKLLDLMSSGIEPIRTSDIFVFDRYYSKTYEINETIFRSIISALHSHSALQINYFSGNGTAFDEVYYPIHIEYSKRDDRFRLYAMAESSKQIYIMNIDRIKAVSICDKSFDMDICQKELSGFIKRTSSKVAVEFKDTKNIPDRILNEFAPWRKRCELIDRKAGSYRLTLYYNKYDENDILIRLMSYGPYIRITDKNHTIYKEIMERIQKQNELFKAKKESK